MPSDKACFVKFKWSLARTAPKSAVIISNIVTTFAQVMRIFYTWRYKVKKVWKPPNDFVLKKDETNWTFETKL